MHILRSGHWENSTEKSKHCWFRAATTRPPEQLLSPIKLKTSLKCRLKMQIAEMNEKREPRTQRWKSRVKMCDIIIQRVTVNYYYFYSHFIHLNKKYHLLGQRDSSERARSISGWVFTLVYFKYETNERQKSRRKILTTTLSARTQSTMRYRARFPDKCHNRFVSLFSTFLFGFFPLFLLMIVHSATVIICVCSSGSSNERWQREFRLVAACRTYNIWRNENDVLQCCSETWRMYRMI